MMDRRALAGLFDALIFLAIAALVSVSLLSMLGAPSSETDDREMDRVEAAHTVLLRSTVIDASGNPGSLERLFMLENVDGGRYENNITLVLDLLLPGREWRWSVHYGDRSWTFGGEVMAGEVHCSILRTSFDGSELEFRLESWPAYS
ncbi:MAG: hypothetical protein ISF22_07655 [Methanomassiliicoccus sp.]|nr:hypothetical protein [Methanomassiliicoccus sp.]